MAGRGLRRREDWQRRLDAALAGARGRAFAWGEHDCALFAADMVDAMCGSAVAARFRGRYKTARGAAGRLRRMGGVEAVMARHGLVERAPLMAQRGDVVEVPVVAAPDVVEYGEIIFGICLGEQVAGAALRGWWLVPLRQGVRAWHLRVEGEA